ncbi:uncharacterized protein [Palaemon carinicauda]|uniref:uncharacterized protein n=1 Tax=Palaemon carinicauda TaxID=392227 RepID=UPI0035B5BE5B
MAAAVVKESLSRPPKLLRKQAADRFALHIIKKALPCIEVGLDRDMEDQDLNYKLHMLSQLRKMKHWYWHESNFLGHIRSKNRLSISNSLMDVLDWKKTYRRIPMLHRFVIQLLFCCEVGTIDRWQEMVMQFRDCQALNVLLRSMGTLYFTEFYDTSIKLMDTSLLSRLFDNASGLSMIHLQNNLNIAVIEAVQWRSETLEILKLDIEGMYISTFISLENPLYKLFFGNYNKNEVTLCLNEGRRVPLSFPNLREVVFRFDISPRHVLQLVFCIHHFYPRVKVMLASLVSLPYDSIQRKQPFIFPSFMVVKSDESKKVYTYCKEEYCAEFSGEYNHSFVCSSEVYSNSITFIDSLGEIRKGMMSSPQVTTVNFIYHERILMFITPTLSDSAESLTELHIYGLIETSKDKQNFSQGLSKCKNLKELELMMKLTISPEMTLAEMPNLKSLSINFATFSHLSLFGVAPDLWTPVGEFIEDFLLIMVKAATALEFLHIPRKCNPDALAESECLQQLKTLSMGDVTIENFRRSLRKLPALSTVVVGSEFGYKKYLSLKKQYKCTDLKVVYKKERLVTPYS